MKINQNQLSLAIINAYGFYKTGLLGRKNIESTNISGQTLLNIIPSTVNICLSAELMLKILISQNNLEFIKTHKLLDLYNILPVHLKLAIYNAYKLLEPLDESDFENNIRSISDTFVNWRYYGITDWTNKKNLEFEFAYRFSTILKNLVFAINKETVELIKKLEE